MFFFSFRHELRELTPTYPRPITETETNKQTKMRAPSRRWRQRHFHVPFLSEITQNDKQQTKYLFSPDAGRVYETSQGCIFKRKTKKLKYLIFKVFTNQPQISKSNRFARWEEKNRSWHPASKISFSIYNFASLKSHRKVAFLYIAIKTQNSCLSTLSREPRKKLEDDNWTSHYFPYIYFWESCRSETIISVTKRFHAEFFLSLWKIWQR